MTYPGKISIARPAGIRQISTHGFIHIQEPEYFPIPFIHKKTDKTPEKYKGTC
jgi:hypothetical protein